MQKDLEIELTLCEDDLHDFRIAANGLCDPSSICNGTIPHLHVIIRDLEVFGTLIDYSLNTVQAYFSTIQTAKKVDYWEKEMDIRLSLSPLDDCLLIVYFSADLEEWRNHYSPAELSNAFELTLKPYKSVHYDYGIDYGEAYYSFGLKILNRDLPLVVYLNQLEEICKEVITDSKKVLTSRINEETFITYFRFPGSVKTACKQYLLYFAQFLSDLGIKAETEIAESNETTIFKVVPEDTTQALEKIKEALETYLQAPNLPEIPNSTNDPAVAQWQANILHLKSQLMLTQSMLQMKDATIEALQLSNYQFKQIVEAKEQGKEEDIIKDVVSIKRYDGDWFSINLPELLRRLKRRFE